MTALSPAPALSPEEARRVAKFDAAEEPEEVTVERVARALEAACVDGASWQTLATAALTALRGDRAPLAGRQGDARPTYYEPSAPAIRLPLAGQHTTDEGADR